MSKTEQVRAGAASRFRRVGQRSRHATLKWVNGMNDYANDYVDMAAEVIEGQTSLSEFVCGAAALWFEAGSAACNFYHDLCAPLPSVGGSGVVFFEIDPLSQCADPFALGNVRASDLPDLWSSELSCSPPGPSITADKVRLSTYRDDVLVSLINLPTSQFQVGQIYEGRIKRSSDGSFVAAIIVKVVSEIE